MKQISIVGRIAKNAVVKEFSNNKFVSFSVAVDDGFGDKKKTLWFECEYYNTNVCEHIRGGDPIAVSGEFKVRDYNDKTYFKIKANALQLLGNKKREPNRYAEGDNFSDKNNQEVNEDLDDEIPF